MFEITFIETYPDGTLVMVHNPFADEDDETIRLAIENENRCVENGTLVAYTTITFHERWNRPDLYRDPGYLAIPSV